MGLLLFMLGAVFVVAGIASGLPMYHRDAAHAMGGPLALVMAGSLIGLGLAVTGLMIGKTKAPPPPPAPRPPPAAPPPPPMQRACPTCGKNLLAGQNVCLFCHPPVQAPPPPPSVEHGIARRGRGAVEGPNGYLQVLDGPSAGKQVAIKAPMTITIGRADDNFIAIQDADVSGHHCQLVCANDRIDFYDLGSSNGSFVNEQPIKTGKINSGDQLRLGRTTKIFFDFK